MVDPRKGRNPVVPPLGSGCGCSPNGSPLSLGAGNDWESDPAPGVGIFYLKGDYELAMKKVKAGVWTDKEAHCWLSCRMAWAFGAYGAGAGLAMLVGWWKEVIDVIDPDGTFDLNDLLADVKGNLCAKAFWSSCAECCGVKGK